MRSHAAEAGASADERLGRRTRVSLGLGAGVLLVVLAVAGWLEPDPRGFGTHTQLGLPPCSFRVATGRPCPGCGMTTAFAWSVRGRFGASWRANPAGSLLAPGCLVLAVWLGWAAVRGRPGPFRGWEGPLVGGSVAAVALTVVSWMIRMTLGG